MDALELLKKWPSWEKANAATVLASPAWRMPVKFDGRDAVLSMVDAPDARDAIALGVHFDGDGHTLCLFDSAAFADLHMLWDRRASLPKEVVLALVEKECGGLLQMLEDVVRKQLSIDGLKDAAAVEPPPSERVFLLQAGSTSITFSMDVSPAMEIELGKLEYLDPAHESIRALTRPAEVEYAVIPLTEEETSSLAPGDLVLPPDDAVPKWTVDKPLDGQLHVRGAQAGELTFAQIADQALPPVPESDSFVLMRFGGKIAAGSRSRVGDHAAVRIDEMF